MKQRIRIGRLDTAGGIAYERGKILKRLMRELIDPQLATRLSGTFVNERTLMDPARVAAFRGPIVFPKMGVA